MKLSIIPILFFLAIFLIPTSAFAITTNSTVYTCDSPSSQFNDFHIANQTDFFNPIAPAESGSFQMNISGVTSVGCLGLAQHPITEVWYVGIRDNSADPINGNWLATIDPTTGIGAVIGNIDNGINGIAFNSTGHLWAMPNSQATPEQDILRGIDITTGLTTSESCQLNGNFGQPSVLAYNWDNDLFYTVDPNGFEGQIRTLTDMGASDCGESVQTLLTDFVPTPDFALGLPQSMVYNTNDGLFYMHSQSDTNQQNQVTTIDPITLIHTRIAGDITDFFPNSNEFADIFQRGIAFELITSIPDAVSPVISATQTEPITLIQDSTFLAFEHVQCIDDVDGAIVPNGNFATDGGITIDTSIRGVQSQDYTCTDAGANTGLATIDYIIKKKSTGNSGGTSSTSQLSDIPTLSFSDDASQVGADLGQTGQSISDLFSNLFSNRLSSESGERIDFAQEIRDSVQSISERASPTVSSGSPTTSDRPSPVADFFRDLFSGFFN